MTKIFETGFPDGDFDKALRKMHAAKNLADRNIADAQRRDDARFAIYKVAQKFDGARGLNVLVVDGDLVLVSERE